MASAAAVPSAAKSASNSNPARVHVPIPKDTRNRLVSGIFHKRCFISLNPSDGLQRKNIAFSSDSTRLNSACARTPAENPLCFAKLPLRARHSLPNLASSALPRCPAAPHPPGIPRPFLFGPAAAQPALLAFQPQNQPRYSFTKLYSSSVICVPIILSRSRCKTSTCVFISNGSRRSSISVDKNAIVSSSRATRS